MRRLHVEVLLLTGLLVMFVVVVLVAPWVRANTDTSGELTKWGAMVLTALITLLTASRDRNK